MFVMFCAVSGS